ncbi:MAG: hypothetical protein JM58_06105 [Peptococcaceae bacterium BICA1-8]|nr:MAG: hypothetical protein JM58_06105 [Peptococcaceae bacterium BICA1-8]
MKNNMMKMTERFFENIPSDKHGIDLVEFETLMILGDIKEYFLLDVRENEDFQLERIPGSDFFVAKRFYVGYICYPDDGKSVHDVIIKSDEALLSAKRQGKNRCKICS